MLVVFFLLLFHVLQLEQKNTCAAVTVTSALAFKVVGPKAGCLSTAIETIFRRMSVVKRLLLVVLTKMVKSF